MEERRKEEEPMQSFKSMLCTFNWKDIKNLEYPPKMLALKKLEAYISKLEKKQKKTIPLYTLSIPRKKPKYMWACMCGLEWACMCVCVY